MRNIAMAARRKVPFRNSLWKWYRLAILLSLDASMLTVSYWMAYVLRLDLLWPRDWVPTMLLTLPAFVVAHLSANLMLGMYRQVWKFANYDSAVLIARCVMVGTMLFVAAAYFLPVTPRPPRSVPAIAALISLAAICFTRFFWRSIAQVSLSRAVGPKELSLVYGAGAAGDLLLRHAISNPHFPYRVVGLIDDNMSKRNRIIHGLRILGTGEELAEICRNHGIRTVILAMPSTRGDVVRGVVARCHHAGVKPLIMPDMASALTDEIIRPRAVDVADLLRRLPKGLELDSVHRFVHGKVVLITGGGGSIGSEIARQVARGKPSQLILLDASEFNLYKIESELKDAAPELKVVAVLGSTTNRQLVEEIFEHSRPGVVLHAAAYKHVPLLECNELEGVTNNILGTKTVAEAAIRHGTSHFLLISTDKAVRPTNVMGATKRACELLVQGLDDLQENAFGTRTVFCAVRFGNVLGSSGSVIPRFMEQIQRGGPVTVTHPDVTRYFMLTSEAVGLVLQAVTLAKGGEIFVLNMGDQVRIYDMAKQLIRLAGKEPGRDIEVVITGLRPGEKLFEELLIEGTEKHIRHDDLYIATPGQIDPEAMRVEIDGLLRAAQERDRAKALAILHRLIERDRNAGEAAVASDDLVLH
jgi:FlaA1/EpsC-like NDP-sugar epimerase